MASNSANPLAAYRSLTLAMDLLQDTDKSVQERLLDLIDDVWRLLPEDAIKTLETEEANRPRS